MTPPLWDGFSILIGAATEDKGSGWFNATVAAAIVAGVAGIIVAWLNRRRPESDDDAAEAQPQPAMQIAEPPPDVLAAAAARVQALETDGPARDERMSNSRLALEKAARELVEPHQARLRELALGLAESEDLDHADQLRKQLVALAPPANR